MIRSVLFMMSMFLLLSCGGKKDQAQEEIQAKGVIVPIFNSDSAYRYAEKQVGFGPRIPNTSAHRLAGEYLTTALKGFGAAVKVQDFEATTYDGQRLSLRNIIASYSTERQKRILLAAHWDTRPFADKDSRQPNAMFDGANDGASGVAILLEMARNLAKDLPPEVGVDIIFFDGEDWGERDDATKRIPLPDGTSWWCLGSQYWAAHKHKSGYTAYYGILLDMVGARGAHFFQEGYSMEYAPKIVEKVWGTAARLGYSSTFVRQRQAPITDDHLFVNEMGKIPMIDIVHYDPALGYFGDFHHTQKDALSLIDKGTLGTVGNVLMNVVYKEQ